MRARLAVVVQGTVELEVGGQRRRISSAADFNSSANSLTVANIGRTTAVVVCACTPSLI